jgi:hypothetical protein
MQNSIETIWKEGFLNERSLVAPRINDLYNQKSRHLVDKVIGLFRINLIVIIMMAILFPIIHYFLGVFLQGAAASVLLLLSGWYSKRLMRGVTALDPGANSLEYLKSFDRWLKDVYARSVKIVRFSYPLYFLIAASTVWSAWNNQEEMVLRVRHRFPDLVFVWNIPVFALIIIGVTTLLMFYFSDKIYKWDVRLMYGRVFDKLEETIAEMEGLKDE